MEEFIAQYDIFLAIGVLVLTLVYLYTIGKDYGVTIVLGLYMAMITVEFVPLFRDLTVQIEGLPGWGMKIILLAVFLLVFVYLQIHNGYFEPQVVPSGWETPIFAIVFAGSFCMACVSYFPPEVTDIMSYYGRFLFVEDPLANVWFLGLPLTLLFIRGEA